MIFFRCFLLSTWIDLKRKLFQFFKAHLSQILDIGISGKEHCITSTNFILVDLSVYLHHTKSAIK